MSVSKADVLAALRRANTPMWAGDLSDLLGLDFAKLENVRFQLNQLERDGIVERLPHQERRGSRRVYYRAVPVEAQA